MSKFKEETQEFTIKPEEITRLRESLTAKQYDGTLTAFEQVMVEWGYAKMIEGVYHVTDPERYTFWSRVHAKIEAYDWYTRENERKSNPEERNALRGKIKALRASMEKVLTVKRA